MLSYSERALQARVQFYAPYNRITVIVEDTKLENFYTRLLTRLIGDNSPIRRVIGVGGKSQVLQRHLESSQRTRTTIEFYVVDGDFDELLDIVLPIDCCLYRLPRYDIESFLVDPMAISIIAEEQNPQHPAEYYLHELNFDRWLRRLLDDVQLLIACHVVMNQLSISSTHIRKIERFVPGNGFQPSVKSIKELVRQAAIDQEVLSEQEFNQRMKNVIHKMGTSIRERVRWISGKDILLPLIIRYLKSETGTNVSLDSLRFRLAVHCEFDELIELKERLLTLLPE